MWNVMLCVNMYMCECAHAHTNRHTHTDIQWASKGTEKEIWGSLTISKKWFIFMFLKSSRVCICVINILL